MSTECLCQCLCIYVYSISLYLLPFCISCQTQPLHSSQCLQPSPGSLHAGRNGFWEPSSKFCSNTDISIPCCFYRLPLIPTTPIPVRQTNDNVYQSCEPVRNLPPQFEHFPSEEKIEFLSLFDFGCHCSCFFLQSVFFVFYI